MTWLQKIGPIQVSPITPVSAVPEGENFNKKSREVEAVDEEKEESENGNKRKKVFKLKKAKKQDARLKELLEKAASQQFLNLFYQSQRPLKSSRFPKKFYEKERTGSFYREVRPLSAKSFVERVSQVFHSLSQEKVSIKKKNVIKKNTEMPAILPLALCVYIESNVQEPVQEKDEILDADPLHQKFKHSFENVCAVFHRKNSSQNIEETIKHAGSVDVGQQKVFSSPMKKSRGFFSRHFWFCLSGALNKYAKVIDQKTKSRFMSR